MLNARREPYGLALLVISLGSASPAPAGALPGETSGIERITVDARKVLARVADRPLGINLDFLTDDDDQRASSAARSLPEALGELGSKYLRYPGGWKSAINLWSVPPFAASHPVLAGRVPERWIRPGLRLTEPDGSWRIDPLDFDEFMELCRALSAEPCVVVPYESCYWPATGEWRPPTRARLLETATAWVRYANRAGHRPGKVRYWEIGNESWLNNETWTNRIAAETYAADLVEFARQMKAVDPAIRVGANGDHEAWWGAVLGRAAAQVDFLSVHSYPCWKWSGYEEYRTNEVDPLGAVRTAVAAIEKYAPAHRRRLEIMMTEFAAGAFGDWDQTPADLGRALITFDLQGQLLQCPEVRFSQFWTTHNVYTDLDGGVFAALRNDNQLSPVGRALWIWSRFLGDEMLATTSTAAVRCYATYQPRRQLVVFLINKELSERPVRVDLRRLPRQFTRGDRWTLRGTSPSDQRPTWDRRGEIAVRTGALLTRLDPVSITVIALQSGRLEADDGTTGRRKGD